MTYAKGWALRCQLELQQHDHAVWTTLTYADAPPTLQKRDLQLFLKRLRKDAAGRTIRFFASGEYGETNYRPHYHAILYGLNTDWADRIEDHWAAGITYTVQANAANIAYTAGYTSKKAGWQARQKEERIDPDTGEVYNWQPPFIQMSRGGRTAQGIGAAARKWVNSWRNYAVHHGHQMPVPRYLHQAWKDQASEADIQQLQLEKLNDTLDRYKNQTEFRNLTEELHARRKIHDAKQQLRAARRQL